MNCDFPDPASDAGQRAPDNSRGPAGQRLRDDLADGLHSMAQPLTILRGALGALTLRGTLTSHQRRYLEMSTRQLGRLNSLFRALQDLVDTTECKPRMVASKVNELIDQVLEETECALLDSGIRIEHPDLTCNQAVFADRECTERALRAALRLAAAKAAPQESIEISIFNETNSIRLEIGVSAQADCALNDSDRLNLSLAQKNIVSQGGRFSFVAAPLSVSLILPLTPAQKPCADESLSAQGALEMAN